MESLILGAIANQARAEVPPVEQVGMLTTDSGVFSYPRSHQPMAVVPQGGSSCANCKFAVVDAPGGATCTSPDFIAAELPGKPIGTGLLPLPPEQMCTDWWQAQPAQAESTAQTP